MMNDDVFLFAYVLLCKYLDIYYGDKIIHKILVVRYNNYCSNFKSQVFPEFWDKSRRSPLGPPRYMQKKSQILTRLPQQRLLRMAGQPLLRL